MLSGFKWKLSQMTYTCLTESSIPLSYIADLWLFNIRSHYTVQAGLELVFPSASASWVLDYSHAFPSSLLKEWRQAIHEWTLQAFLARQLKHFLYLKHLKYRHVWVFSSSLLEPHTGAQTNIKLGNPPALVSSTVRIIGMCHHSL